MSILPLLLLMGVASSKYVGNYGNDDKLQPIVSTSQSRRICAELCTAGLGGKACGDECLDIVPDNLPIQSANSSRDKSAASAARSDACPILCANQLGEPLCNCGEAPAAAKVDFVQVCSYFCVQMDHHIHGCQSCSVYKQYSAALMEKRNRDVDWDEWCKQMCAVGDGGAACNCDILPMMAGIGA